MNISTIISKSIDRDRLAQKKLVLQFAPYLYGVCLRYLHNPEDAKDALQDTFILIFKNLEQFHSPTTQFKYWARKIAINTAISKTRRASYHRESPSDKLPDTGYHPAQNLEAQYIIKHINQLPEIQKIVFNLFAIDGYQHKEIAQILNLKEQDSKNALFKARKKLQNLIAQSENKTV